MALLEWVCDHTDDIHQPNGTAWIRGGVESRNSGVGAWALSEDDTCAGEWCGALVGGACGGTLARVICGRKAKGLDRMGGLLSGTFKTEH